MAYPSLETFRSKLSAPTPSGCLEWQRSRNAGGYGVCTYWDSDQHKRRSMGAHRMAYLLSNPGEAVGGIVEHTCGNPACCNPDHLLVASAGGGGQVPRRPRKFSPRQRKLTDDVVRAVRAMGDAGSTDMHISLLFDLSSTYVRAVRLRQRKAHVSEDGPVAAIPEAYVRY